MGVDRYLKKTQGLFPLPHPGDPFRLAWGGERGKHFVYLPTFPSSSSSASSPCLLIEASWEAVGGTHIFRVWEEMKVLS